MKKAFLMFYFLMVAGGSTALTISETAKPWTSSGSSGWSSGSRSWSSGSGTSGGGWGGGFGGGGHK